MAQDAPGTYPVAGALCLVELDAALLQLLLGALLLAQLGPGAPYMHVPGHNERACARPPAGAVIPSTYRSSSHLAMSTLVSSCFSRSSSRRAASRCLDAASVS